jgi:hypothetical protein
MLGGLEEPGPVQGNSWRLKDDGFVRYIGGKAHNLGYVSKLRLPLLLTLDYVLNYNIWLEKKILNKYLQV